MLRILINGIGGPTPRSIAKTIRLTHEDSFIIGIDANPKAIGFFIPGLINKHYVVPPATDNNYWSVLTKLIQEEKIDMAFVQPEVEVVAWGNFYNNSKKYPCPVLIPPLEIASVLMNKAEMASELIDTEFIPKTIKIISNDFKLSTVEETIGFPCWIRASKGSGGLGSLKLENVNSLGSWLFINREIKEFTISEFLPGRHLATQMLYYNGKYIKGASLECVEYVMANIAPSKVTGNTSFGRLLNENRILKFCNDCINYLSNKLNIEPHGVFSFDLKEDIDGNLKVTEINIRHMAYTGVMANAGFNLVEDTINLLMPGDRKKFRLQPYFIFDKPYVFLRDVDSEPILLESEKAFLKLKK